MTNCFENNIWARRTGLPGLLAGGFASDESEEEDEADEDSNGASHILQNVITSDPKSCLNPTAEEYYKNDYPDEESSDYDTSEGSDGASSSVPCSSFFSGSSSVYT